MEKVLSTDADIKDVAVIRLESSGSAHQSSLQPQRVPKGSVRDESNSPHRGQRPLTDLTCQRGEKVKEENPVGFFCRFSAVPGRTGQGPQDPPPRPLPRDGCQPPARPAHLWPESTRGSSPLAARRGAARVTFPSLKSRQERRKSSRTCQWCRRRRSPCRACRCSRGRRGGCPALGGSAHHGERRTRLRTANTRSLVFLGVSCCLRFVLAF